MLLGSGWTFPLNLAEKVGLTAKPRCVFWQNTILKSPFSTGRHSALAPLQFRNGFWHLFISHVSCNWFISSFYSGKALEMAVKRWKTPFRMWIKTFQNVWMLQARMSFSKDFLEFFVKEKMVGCNQPSEWLLHSSIDEKVKMRKKMLKRKDRKKITQKIW